MAKKECKQECDCQKFAEDLFALYSQNSFGSISKRELDLFLFANFKKMEKIQGNSSWEIAKELKISKSKAQTLLYESDLRYPSQGEDELIQKVLNKVPQTIDKGVVSIIVDSRYVRDCIRNFLATNGFFTDLSFASDVVKMPVEAYWKLQEVYNGNVVKALKDKSFLNKLKDYGNEALIKFVSTVGDSLINSTVTSFFEYLQNNF